MHIRSRDDRLLCGSSKAEAALDRPESGGVFVSSGSQSVELALLRGMGGLPLGEELWLQRAFACLAFFPGRLAAGGLSIACFGCTARPHGLHLPPAARFDVPVLNRVPGHAFACVHCGPGRLEKSIHEQFWSAG
jgi:hypothetical protein